MESPEIQELTDGITFSIMVQPRSSKNEITGIQSGNLKVKLTSPPIENAANQLCIKLFSQWLDINKSKIQIIRGLKNRNKKIKIYGLNKNDFDLFIKKLSLTQSGQAATTKRATSRYLTKILLK